MGYEVDLVCISVGELESGDIRGTLGGWDVGEEEGVERWVGGHVGEVDVNSRGIGANGGPLDGVGFGRVPKFELGGRGDGHREGDGCHGGEGEDRSE